MWNHNRFCYSFFWDSIIMKLLLVFFIFFNAFSGDNLLVFPEKFPSDHQVIKPSNNFFKKKRTSQTQTRPKIELGPQKYVGQTFKVERHSINIFINNKWYQIKSEKNIEDTYLLLNKNYTLVIVTTGNGYAMHLENSYKIINATSSYISIYNFCKVLKEFKLINEKNIDSVKSFSLFMKNSIKNFLIDNNNQLALYFDHKMILTYDDWKIPLHTEENEKDSVFFKQKDFLDLNHDDFKKTTQTSNTNGTDNVIKKEIKENNNNKLNSNDLNSIDTTVLNQSNNLGSNDKNENSKLKLPSTIMKHLINNIKPVIFVLSLLCGAFLFYKYMFIVKYN